MKLLVCGGRDYRDYARLNDVLQTLYAHEPFSILIHGAAPGADTLAGHWADAKGVPCAAIPADWARNGKAAGPIRNQQMLNLGPDMVVAFPGGSGTADMVRRAKAAGVQVVEVDGSSPSTPSSPSIQENG